MIRPSRDAQVRIAIVGAGIKGASTAALLAQDPTLAVTIFEASSPGAGASSTNHGRLHSGAAGWRQDSDLLLSRRRRGSEIWRFLGIGSTQQAALYGFDTADLMAAFRERLAKVGIWTRVSPDATNARWFRHAEHFVEVAEFEFSPTDAVGALLARARRGGVSVRTGAPVSRVEARASALALSGRWGEDEYDVVVVCAGRWLPGLDLSWRSEPLVQVEWFAWRVLMGRQPRDSYVKRVLVNTDAGNLNESVVPHGAHLTFDMKAVPMLQVPVQPLSLEPHDARRIPVDVATDEMYRVCLEAFPWLSGVGGVSSFEGIQPRVSGAAPGSIGQVLSDPTEPRLVASQGGQASTAMLDALDLHSELWRAGVVRVDPYVALSAIDLPDSDPDLQVQTMPWEE